jgi:peptidoglycan/LPS O-acetylase OafA/YrhL
VKHQPELDGVRGIAIILVVALHIAEQTKIYVLMKVFALGWIGVDLFFVLSGFLITSILLQSRDDDHYFFHFYARRILRIFPLYFGFLGLTFALLPSICPAPVQAQIRQELPWYVAYLYNWRAAGGFGVYWLGHLWSLAVEEQFYFIWPFIVFVFPLAKLRRVCCALVVVAFLSRCYFATHGLQGFAYFSTIARFDDLALGGLAATFIGQRTLLPRRALIAGTTMFLLTLISSRGFEVHKRLVITVGTAAVGIAFFGLVMMASLEQWAWLRRRELTWAGKYSYGIYLFHFPLVIWAGSTNSPVLLLATIPASLLLACLSYHAFEKHFLALKRYVKYEGTGTRSKVRNIPLGKLAS